MIQFYREAFGLRVSNCEANENSSTGLCSLWVLWMLYANDIEIDKVQVVNASSEASLFAAIMDNCNQATMSDSYLASLSGQTQGATFLEVFGANNVSLKTLSGKM